MTTLAAEKRKHDEPRRVPWWLILLVGFALGIIFTLSMSMGRGGTVVSYSPASAALPDNLAAQATQIIAEATLNAQALQNHAG